jgi:2-octaprenyl-6-methoxyphenol hydroxylase
MNSYDLIIIGGGINGMTTACALSEAGFKTALVEKSNISQRLKNTRDGRGLSIARHSKDILEKYNIWDFISKGAGEMHKIIVQDANSDSILEFDNKLVGGEPLGFLIESDNVLSGLYSKLLKSKVDIFDDSGCKSLESGANESKVHLLNGEVIKSKLVIVTDGKDSGIRAMLGMSCNKKEYDQTALVFNIKHSHPHNNCAYELFMKNGPFALLPMQDPYQSSIVWCEKKGIEKIDLSDKEFAEYLMIRCAPVYDEVKIITGVTKFPLSLSYMDEYYKDRAVFIGDSLHFMHPVAGQGYNLSIRDIDRLVELFLKYQCLGLDIGSQSLLKEFQAHRQRDNKSMMRFTDGINNLFSNDNSMVQFCRRFGLQVVNEISPLKKFFMKKAMGY